MSRYDLRCYLAAAVAALAYSVAAAEYGYAVFILLALGTAWMASGGNKGRPVPRWVINALLGGAGLFALTGLLDGALDVNDFSRLIGVLLVIKMLDRRSPRDDAQLLTLSAFLTIGGVLTSASLMVAVLVMIEIFLLLPTVLRFHIARVEHEAASSAERLGAPSGLPAGERPGLPPVLSFSDATGESVGRAVRSLLIAAVVAGVLVFLVMPRGLGRSSFGAWGSTATGTVVGFDEEVELGSGGLISSSTEVVADVTLRNADGRLAIGESEVLYLRGAVLDEYRSGRWVRSDVRRRDSSNSPIVFSGQTVPLAARRGQPETLEVTLRGVGRGRSVLFTLWRPLSVAMQSGQRVVHGRADFQVERIGPPGSLTYEVQVDRYATGPDRDRDLEELLESPRPEEPPTFDSEVVAEIAAAVLDEAGISPDPLIRPRESDERVVRLFETHLRSEYGYTLDILPSRGDPIEYFLTESRLGHCEYFASAMAAMCRSVGIGARVVTGYVATEWNPSTEHYTVRESNAHAWVEAEVLPGYWRRYDPTPSADFAAIHQPTPTLWSEARKLAQAIEFAWVSAIVAFDGERQSEIAAALGFGGGADAEARVRQRPERVWTRQDAFRFFSASLVVAGAVLSLAGFAGLIARLGPVRRLLGRVRGKGYGASIGFYRGLLHAADRLGRPRTPGESAMEHAEAAAAYAGSGASEARALVGLYYRAVFDPRGLTERQQAEAAELERAVRRAWRRRPPVED